MGADLSIYVGPMIQIPTRKVTLPTHISTCGEHENYSGDKFCPECGGEIYDDVKNEEVDFSVEEIVGEDRFIQIDNPSGTTTLITNFYNIGLDIDDDSGDMVIPISHDDIGKAKEKFGLKHKTDISKLEEAFDMDMKIIYGYAQRWW